MKSRILTLVIAFAVLFGCQKEEQDQQVIIQQNIKSGEMGKVLSVYGGFTSQQLKDKSSVPLSSDIVVGSDNINCSNIKLSHIANVLGVGDTSLVALCTSPNVNKWSGFSPIEWYSSNSQLLSRPKTPYVMGNFAGYNHNAATPSVTSKPNAYTINYGTSSVMISHQIKTGELNYSSLNIKYIALEIWRDNGTTYIGRSKIDVSSITESPDFRTLDYTYAMQGSTGETIQSRIVFLNQYDEFVAYYHGETGFNNISITVATNTVFVNRTKIGLNDYRLLGSVYETITPTQTYLKQSIGFETIETEMLTSLNVWMLVSNGSSTWYWNQGTGVWVLYSSGMPTTARITTLNSFPHLNLVVQLPFVPVWNNTITVTFSSVNNPF